MPVLKKIKAKKDKLKIEMVPVKTIKPHPKNARLHDERNISAISKSLETFGQRTPIVVGKNNRVLKGCGTLQAARGLKWKDIQIVRCLNLTTEQELAYALADNKTSDTSEFDFQTVSELIKFLDGKEFDLEATGFADFEREPLMQAKWSPDTVGKLPTSEESGETGKSIRFLPEQWARLAQCCEDGEKLGLITHGDGFEEAAVKLAECAVGRKRKKTPPQRKKR